MIHTFTALLFAHMLADFVLQTDWIIRNKARFGVLLLHAALVLLTAQATTGQLASAPLLVLAGVHLLIDCIKTYGRFSGLSGFMTDQAAHLVTLAVVAVLVPDLWQTGMWAALPQLLPLMALLAGLIATITAGQYAIGLLMRPHATRIRNNGLKQGGRLIGMLERGLIFALILLGQPLGVGFLVASKSILRFGTATRDQRTAEYVIIGTLASFGWAILAAYATQWLLSCLPPLEIAAQQP
ncbi:DUF3307 domain-containing protein [Thalassovita taeanensis]|uniref:DUF3307 domain-containing protein n=1 Tax=Thalassovita taeanensis TaxID=657014 RepID=A0A1H9KSD3_9RHOB|nr:DUF3307 domain-containing protein [Thalassovita taeanensis]SER02104.1 Protein of unknown function [Thalassovita taeanensis]